MCNSHYLIGQLFPFLKFVDKSDHSQSINTPKGTVTSTPFDKTVVPHRQKTRLGQYGRRFKSPLPGIIPSVHEYWEISNHQQQRCLS
ncbi:hypothetical protein SCFA_540003 [anaerobic digester metagenome]|uniref:Uncharacterized protein n=1 Tax=anaerobic digester metagenome TaxID=1263854 RepID=A0A485M3N8_9ZZZZ